LPPKLDLNASTVCKTIAAFGLDVMLATVRLDTFRGHFLTEGQANVLKPLEKALNHKQKADKISCN
jgi:hypothetical protein